MNTVKPRRPPLSRPAFRILLIIAAVLAAFAYILPPVATRIIGEDVLRAQAQAALSSALDRPVDIQGDVRLTMFPWFGLRTGKVAVPNTPGFSPVPLLTVESVAISLDIPALFSRSIVVDSISLAAATLNFERDATGHENWFIPSQRPASGLTSGGWKVERLPAGLRLNDATLSFSDKQTGLSVNVKRLNLNSNASRPFDFSLSCEVTINPSGVTGEIHVAGQGNYDDTGEHITIGRTKAAGWLELPRNSAQRGERVTFSGKVKVDGALGAFEVADLALEGAGARITGQVNAAGLYENQQPYVYLNLLAKADRRGSWAKLLGLGAERRLHTGGSEPAFTMPEPTGNVEAELELSSTPMGWKASRFSLLDGQGKVSGSARSAEGEVDFDITAHDWDLGRWLSPGMFSGAMGGGGIKTLQGRFSGTSLRFGAAEIAALELSAQGQQGEFRIYPFTVRTPQALLSSDIRVKSGPSSAQYTCLADIQALNPESAGQQSVLGMATLNVSGEAGTSGLTGKAQLSLNDFPKEWKPTLVPEDLLKAWALLGGGNAASSFRYPSDGAWEIADLDVHAGGSRISGGIAGGPAGINLDLQADRLELDKVRRLGALFGFTEDGFTPSPVNGRVAIKKLTAPGMDIDDLALSGQVSSSTIKLPNVSGTLFGGKLTGSLEIDESKHRRTLSATLAGHGIQGAQLQALWPQTPRISGPLELRFSGDSSVPLGSPAWQGLHGQVDLQMGPGSFNATPEQGNATAWPISRATASLKYAVKPAQPQSGEHARESYLADLSGQFRTDSMSMVRSSQMDIKGQAGLDSSGKPLWFRQPKAECALYLALPFLAQTTPTRFFWSGKFEADLDKGGFNLPSVDINIAGVPGRATLNGQPGQGGMTLSGSVDIPEFNPRDAAPRLGLRIPAGASPDAWRRARISATIGGGFREVRFSHIQALLDDSSITGQATLGSAKNRLELSVNSIDFDKLAPAPKHPDPKNRPEEPLPLAELRELSLESRVRFGRMLRDHLVWENAVTDFTAQGGRFLLRQTAPNFYGGPYLIDIQGDARSNELRARMDLKLSSFSAALLLKDLAGAESLTRGSGDFHVSVETHGATDRALRRHATGSASFLVRDGRLAIRDGAPKKDATPQPSARGKEPQPQTASQPSEGLAFSRLGASFTIREGLAVTRDFVLAGSGMNAKGDGWVNLDEERIDLNLNAAVTDVGDVPIRISGPLYDPKLEIDKSKLIGDTLVNLFKGVLNIPGNVLQQLRRVF